MMVMDRHDHKIQFCRRNYIEKNYRINSIMELLKFSYLNLNICEVVQEIMGVMLLDRIQ
jgi:hypothetical protein